MKDESAARGDQPCGAVLVVAGVIAGYGPSRVNSDRNDGVSPLQHARHRSQREVAASIEAAGRR